MRNAECGHARHLMRGSDISLRTLSDCFNVSTLLTKYQPHAISHSPILEVMDFALGCGKNAEVNSKDSVAGE